MEYTNNLNLKKPGYEDQADIRDINSNMDIVDQHIGELKSDLFNIPNEELFLYDYRNLTEKTLLTADGFAYTDINYPQWLCVSPMIPISMIKGTTIKNAVSWTDATAHSITFYKNRDDLYGIGTSYTPAQDGTLQSVTFQINDELLANYPNAKYVRIAINKDYDFKIKNTLIDLVVNEIRKVPFNSNVFPSYKLNMYNKALFIGDSVTEGFVVDGDIYQVESAYSYPTQFGKIHSKLEITNKSESGISPTGWYNKYFATTDFSQYDLIVVELGYNGDDYGWLRLADLHTPNTNTYMYSVLINEIRANNSNATIILVDSSHSVTDGEWAWKPVLEAIAINNNCKVISLHDTKYANLDSAEFHGEHDSVMDYVHFTRQGYNTKAYVVSRLIAEQL